MQPHQLVQGLNLFSGSPVLQDDRSFVGGRFTNGGQIAQPETRLASLPNLFPGRFITRQASEVATRLRESLDIDTLLQTAVREIGRTLNLAHVEVRVGSDPVATSSET